MMAVPSSGLAPLRGAPGGPEFKHSSLLCSSNAPKPGGVLKLRGDVTPVWHNLPFQPASPKLSGGVGPPKVGSPVHHQRSNEDKFVAYKGGREDKNQSASISEWKKTLL